jgi:hypothetical protein
MTPKLTAFAAPRPRKGPLRDPRGVASLGAARREAF